MNKNRIISFLTSGFSKFVIGLLVLGTLAALAAPSFIPVKPYIDQVVERLKAATGADVSVNGGGNLKLFPSPMLQLYGVKLADHALEHSPVVQVEQLDIGLNIISLLSGTLEAQAITLWNADASFEKGANGAVMWGYLGTSLFKHLSQSSKASDLTFTLQSARVNVANKQTGEAEQLTNIQAQGAWAEKTSIKGSMVYHGVDVQFDAMRAGRNGATPFAIHLSQGADNNLSLQGDVDFTGDNPEAKGKLVISGANIAPLVFPPEQKDTSALSLVNNQRILVEKKELVIPLKLSGDYSAKEGLMQLSNLDLELEKSKAKGEFSWSDGEKKEQKITLDFSTLNITTLYPLLATDKNAPTKATSLENILSDKNRNMAINIKASEVVRDDRKWNGINFSGTLADGALTVNQLNVDLPGDSKLTLFGLVSRTDVQGIRFEGNCEAAGASLKQLLSVFDDSASGLPDMGFGQFNIRSNLFISSELLRLSEADMKFSEIALKGGLVAYFDAKPRIEATVRLRNINFDYVRDAWREHAKNIVSDNYFLRFDNDVNYDWLKRLASSIDFKVDVDGFTFLERKGKDASFRIFAQAGEFGVYNAKFNYGTDITEANLILDVKGDKPNINLTLNTDTFSTEYFAIKPTAIVPEAPALEPAPAAADLPNLTAPAAPVPAAAPVSDGAADKAATDAASPQPPAANALPVQPLLAPKNATQKLITTTPQSLIISNAQAQQPMLPVANGTNQGGWPEQLLDMSWMESINGTFDISVGKLTHQSRLLQNFKMLAKLERNLLTFQTLTFAHWGGSFSINGSLYGGKVPGMSMGFVLASADMKQVLANMLGINEIGGKISISGTVETSGVNLLSWVKQANSQLLFAGRGVTVQGFDVASVLSSVAVSRTAADTFNNVNLSLVSGTGEYSVDGTINVQNGVMSTAGIGMRTGRVLGNIKGDLKLIPWTISLSGLFQFPELSSDTVPTMALRWDGPLVKPTLQVDTQSLEAFVSKRITGN